MAGEGKESQVTRLGSTRRTPLHWLLRLDANAHVCGALVTVMGHLPTRAADIAMQHLDRSFRFPSFLDGELPPNSRPPLPQ